MDEVLFIRVAQLAGEHIHEMTGYNTVPEQTPLVNIPGVVGKQHVKLLDFNYGNYNVLEVIWFSPDDLDDYLTDEETFGEKYEHTQTFDIHSKDAFDLVAQVLMLMGWKGTQLTRLWSMLHANDVKWTWDAIHETKIVEKKPAELAERIVEHAETRSPEVSDGV